MAIRVRERCHPSLLLPLLWLVRELTFFTSCNLGKVDPAPHLGSPVELTLLAGVQMNHPEDVSLVNLVLPLIWVMAVWVGERCHLPTPSPPVVGGRVGTEVLRAVPLQLQYLEE